MGLKALPIQWAGPAEDGLDRILAHIEMEDPAQAARYPEMAPQLADLGRTYREILTVRPFRVVYRTEGGTLRVIAVLRQEQAFDPGRFLE